MISREQRWAAIPAERASCRSAPRSCSGSLLHRAHAQWVQTYEQFYLPAKHNWVFRQNYSGADRLFNAFDYGHAILYEELYTRPGAPVERLEEREYNFLTQKVLKRPPRVPLEEGAIEIAYTKLAPEAKIMFHWAISSTGRSTTLWPTSA